MDKINNCIVISDIHAGCQFGLCPDEVELDGGGYYKSSKYQKFLLKCWNIFWDDWVPRVTREEPYCVVLNGDALDGRHHGATTQVSQNLADQHNIGASLLKPIVEKCDGRFYFIRGTEVHTGQSSENEEKLAKELKAIKDENGRYSRHELYLKVGKCLVHFNHHIGVTGSLAYETTALMKEFSEFCADSARWGLPVPDMVVRSHRHRHAEVRVPTKVEYGYCFVTSSWQLKTPFMYRIAGGRITSPTIGGSLIRQGDEEFYTRHKTWVIERTKTAFPKV